MKGIIKTILPKPERQLLRGELENVIRVINEKGCETVIILDKAGRPLGVPIMKIMREAYGKTVKIYFVNPKKLKQIYVDANYTKSSITQAHVNALEREYPGILKNIAGKNVAIIDEQQQYGHTLRVMKKLFEIAGAKEITARTLSRWEREGDAYSWRRQKLYSVENPPIGRLFKSEKKQLTIEEEMAWRRLHEKMNTRIIPRVVQRLKGR